MGSTFQVIDKRDEFLGKLLPKNVQKTNVTYNPETYQDIKILHGNQQALEFALDELNDSHQVVEVYKIDDPHTITTILFEPSKTVTVHYIGY